MGTILPYVFLFLPCLLVISQLTLVEGRFILDRPNPCLGNQKQRTFPGKPEPICCATTTCHPGQKFEFCTENNGFDTCQNCPKGLTHQDYLNTASFTTQFDPCIQEVDQCVASDQKIINGQCRCDITIGYFGLDKNNCDKDDGSCRRKGYELSQDGSCVPCGKDHFKLQDNYDICTKKTRCAWNQEVNDEGSTTTDRTCRAKKEIPVQSSPSPSTINSSSLNNTREVQASNQKENEWPIYIWWVVGIIGAVCFLIGIGIFIFKQRKKCSTTNERLETNVAQGHPYYCCLCCPRWLHHDSSLKLNITGKNVQVGDNNNMELSDSSTSEAATPSDDRETIMTDSGHSTAVDLDDVSTSLLSDEQRYAAMNEQSVSHSEADTCSGPSSPLLEEQTIPKEISY